MVVSARSGFTLIEILTVILIVGILAAVLVFNLRDASEAANVAMTRSDLGKIEAPVRALNLGEVQILDADGKPVANKPGKK